MNTIFTFLLISLALLQGFRLNAQSAPQSFNYQAVCRGSNGQPLGNQQVRYRVSLLQGSINGATVYSETHLDTTNAQGMSALAIGRGTVLQGIFSSINWGNGPYFFQIAMDTSGGSNYTVMGTHELLSVPYALQAGNGVGAGTALNQLLQWNGSAWVPVTPGQNGQVLTLCNNALTWTNGGQCPGLISSLSCSTAVNNGTLTEGVIASGVSSSISYTGGNAGVYSAQTIASTGVTGLTATLSGGIFASGNGSVSYTISGTPIGNGTASFAVSLGGQSCTLTRVVNGGLISSLSCSTAVNNGTLTEGVAASGVSSSISYTGGNAGPYSAQTIASTGVTGLTATLSAGTFASGSGSVSYTISGTPVGNGTASFAVSLGGQSCTLTRVVNAPIGSWRPGTVHCGTPTQVVDVVNPTTGRTWMDRNLGASRVATSSTDASAYGDLYQWGRFADGHQCRNSGVTSTLSSTDTPGHNLFIVIVSAGPRDWRGTQNNNLWQGVNGINNPCPYGYRLPSESELNSERGSWSTSNSSGAFSSNLKLTVGGHRGDQGSLDFVGSNGGYTSSSINGFGIRRLSINIGNADFADWTRAMGASIRCIKN